MQVVIDIDEDVYKDAKEHMNCTWKSIIAIHNALNNCTVIPKGHGRLIDVDELKKHKYHDGNRYENAVAIAQVDWMPAILEADKETEDGS